jgi:gamma-glutamylcyclotransferase (GGCT)/AIG2-like uncharacterized protein YtfP
MNQVSAEARFFVYGSLTEGLVHFQKIQQFILFSVPARLQATAYRLKVGFPVVVEGGTDTVPGELVTLEKSDLLLGLLDQFHGFHPDQWEKSLYWRKETPVQTEAGVVSAWTYFLNPKHLPKTARPIEDGDWRKSLQAEPALTEKLSERQKQYVLRLGATSGREIVPIDLQLYRELMNLEIIVDKGRRLALSKLGHEVYRYLSR